MDEKSNELVEDNFFGGFQCSIIWGLFFLNNGFYYYKNELDRFFYGLCVCEKYCNVYGIMYGGMMMVFVDGLLVIVVWREIEICMVIVKLNSEFLFMVWLGDWVEGMVWVMCVIKLVVFVECCVYVGKCIIFLVFVIFKFMFKCFI